MTYILFSNVNLKLHLSIKFLHLTVPQFHQNRPICAMAFLVRHTCS